MENLNLFEILQILSKNQNLKAVRSHPQGECFIKWRGKTIDMSQYGAPNHVIKQMVFVGVCGDETENILTDLMIEQQNYNMWSIVKDEQA